MNRLTERILLKKYDTFSFDVFDTLIERDVCLPSDLFEVVGDDLGLDKAKYRQDRMREEHELRPKHKRGEITLEQICQELAKAYPCSAEQLEDAENRAELDACRAKRSIASFYRKCKDHGKKVYIISDMYLSREQIFGMLNKCGIRGYDGIYISNEYHENKRNGELFRIVMNENQIDPRSMIHIGDSIKGDFIGARRAGIHSYFVPKKDLGKRIVHKVKRKIYSVEE